MGSKFWIGCFMILGLSAGVGSFFYLHQPLPFEGTVFESPHNMPAFRLTGIDGQVFSPAELKGQWTWLFFGFTSCPELCPTTMAKLAKTYQHLSEQGIKVLPRVVMISLDPDYDTAERLGNYVKAFDSHFYGARGRESEVSALARQLGIAYEKVVSSQGKATLDHSGAVMVVNPEGQLQAFLTPPYTIEALVQDHLVLIRK